MAKGGSRPAGGRPPGRRGGAGSGPNKGGGGGTTGYKGGGAKSSSSVHAGVRILVVSMATGVLTVVAGVTAFLAHGYGAF